MDATMVLKRNSVDKNLLNMQRLWGIVPDNSTSSD